MLCVYNKTEKLRPVTGLAPTSGKRESPAQASLVTSALNRIYRPDIKLYTGILTLFLLLLVASAGQLHATNESRSLSLYNIKTGERAKILYKAEGVFLDSGLKRINYFMRDWREGSQTNIDPRVVDLLWEIYQETGSRKPVYILSGYRSKNTNNKLKRSGRNVARNSQHVYGRAIDFYIPGVSTKKLRDIALRKQYGGVGYYPNEHTSFIHIDVGNVRHWPKMSEKSLKKVFPNGGSLHVPSNGRTLPHYRDMVRAYGSDGLKPAKKSLSIAKGQKEKAILASLSKPQKTRPDDIILAYGKTDQKLTSAFDSIIKPKNLPVSRKILRHKTPKIPARMPVPAAKKPVSPSIIASLVKKESKIKRPLTSLLSEPKYLKQVRTQMLETKKLAKQNIVVLERSKADIAKGIALSKRGSSQATANTQSISIALTKHYLLALRAMKNG